MIFVMILKHCRQKKQLTRDFLIYWNYLFFGRFFGEAQETSHKLRENMKNPYIIKYLYANYTGILDLKK